MPKNGLEVPASFASLPKEVQPTRPSVNRLIFPCPIPEWPGTVTLPLYIDAVDYNKWWTAAQEGQPEDDTRHWLYFEWQTRFHLAKDWNLEGLDLEQLTPEADKIPDTRIVAWYVNITQIIIKEATNVPNWPAPLNLGRTV